MTDPKPTDPLRELAEKWRPINGGQFSRELESALAAHDAEVRDAARAADFDLAHAHGLPPSSSQDPLEYLGQTIMRLREKVRGRDAQVRDAAKLKLHTKMAEAHAAINEVEERVARARLEEHELACCMGADCKRLARLRAALTKPSEG